MDLKSDGGSEEVVDYQLLETIKFPLNMKGLNDKLPKAKYESSCKTLKLIPEVHSPEIKTVKTSTKLPLPSLKNITS